jgi:hypothetical protein
VPDSEYRLFKARRPVTNRIPFLLLSGRTILVSTDHAESTAETFRMLGGPIREDKEIEHLKNFKQPTLHTTDISAGDVERLKTFLTIVKVEFKPLSDEERKAMLVKKLLL